MIRRSMTILLFALILIPCTESTGIQRFPQPEFESGHEFPVTTTPEPKKDVYEYIDAIVLLACLILASYLILKVRNRRMIFALMIFSLIYFGFWRKGCVCSIGAIQNVTLSIFDSNYVLPIGALLFFILPLIFTLFFGRGFCAAVCPLGAIQDFVLVKPVSVPLPVESALRLFAYVYLAFGVLFAATGSAFLICRYDPFIGFFRLSGDLNILILGVCFLLIGLFVGRPYCRFLCPYGVILRQLSRLSKWKVSITPDDCIKCGLCKDACPFGAIKEPTASLGGTDFIKSKKLLAVLIILLPVLILFGGWICSNMSGSTSRMHSTVRLAERIFQENSGVLKETNDASIAFRSTGRKPEDLYAEADKIKRDFYKGSWLVGAFIGLVAGLKLIGLSIRWNRTEYIADRASCFACGRCFSYCPREHVRLKKKVDS